MQPLRSYNNQNMMPFMHSDGCYESECDIDVILNRHQQAY